MPERRPKLRVAVADDEAVPVSAAVDAAAGESLLAQRGLAGLRAALADELSDDGWTCFWRGYALQFEDLVLAREAWVRAEAGFEQQNDEAGLTLVACGLVQCTSLDNLSYVGFDARAERVTRLCAEPAEITPLGLFRRAARILLAVERRLSAAAVIDDIEHVFIALGAD